MTSTKAKEIADDYFSSLKDLTINSKPLINMLTMLAEDNVEHAEAIVEAVENHLQKVESKFKLPVLYLIDSIVKNVNGAYLNLFTQNIVNTFCGVFEKVDEITRASMWKLRQTWSNVFPATKLYSLDIRVQSIDPAWPITASPPTISSGSIHLNPRFLSMSQVSSTQPPAVAMPLTAPPNDLAPIHINSKREELLNQQKKLLELQKQKVELELLQAKLNLEEQQKQLEEQDPTVKSGMVTVPHPTHQSLQNSTAVNATKEIGPDQQILPSLVIQTSEENQGKPVAPVLPSQVVKQVSKQVSRDKKLKDEFPAAAASLLKNAGTTNGPRIAPASSLMVASARQASRDPRLKATTQQPLTDIHQVTSTSSISTVLCDKLKQQLKMQLASKIKPTMNNPLIAEGSLKHSINDNPINNNKPLNSCKDGLSNRSNQKKERTSSNSNNSLSTNNSKSMNQVGISTNSSLSVNLLSSVSSNTSVNRAHSDTRVKDNKRDTSSSRCDKTTTSSKSAHRKLGNKSRLKQSSSSPTKLIKLDREASPDRSKSRDKESSDSSPTSLRTSPQSSSPLSKNRKKLSSKGRKRSPSPYRIPRRNLSAKEVSTSIGSTGGLTEEEQSGSLIVSPPHPPAFKDIGQNTRQRNYIRRNKEAQGSSPEQSGLVDEGESLIESANKDEDLRAALPPPSVAVAISQKKEDLDLRVLPPQVNKRQSAEHIDGGASKRTKTEKFDALFGHEDVDLRTLTNPKAGRPPTPPPPVISGEDNKASWAKLKSPSKNDREKQIGFDEKRDRDRNKDRLGRPRLYKLSDDTKDRRRGFSSDEDSRPNRRNKDTDKSDRGDRNIEIIMKQAEEQWREGSISKTEYHKLIQEIWQMNEDQKLRAAQRKEKEIGSLVWEKGIEIGGYSPKDGDMGHRKDHHNRNGPRWNQPWQPGPWAHPPFGPAAHFNPEFRPVGPWQNARFPPMRPDFNQFHSGFNSNLGPRMGGMMGPMGSSAPMMPGLLANGPIGPVSINPLNINGPGGLLINGPSRGNLLGHLPNAVNSVNASVQPSSPPQFDEKASSEENRHNRELPSPDPKLLEEISSDTMKSINIDNMPREIRYYGSIGVVFMSWDDPREIGFQDGTRRILIDDKDTITCAFNEPYKEFLYENEVHKIRLGAPTRELYIDDRWYECYFGGPPITVDLGSKKVSIKLEGPPPQVKIGSVKRTDLVIAKINLIINARTMVPVFLDSKPQVFELDGQTHTLEFTDSLKTVLLNGRPFAVEFGGLPKPIMIRDKKHFIRFSVLPRGIRAGGIKIAGMKGESPEEGSNDLPVVREKSETPGGSVSTGISGLEHDSASQDASDLQTGSKSDLQLDMLSSALSTAMAPASGMSYEAEPTDKKTPVAPVLPLNLNLNELFQRLVDTGIVPKITGAAAEVKKESTEVKKEPEAPLILFEKPETLKLPPNFSGLYSGMQCGSCSLRFGPDRPMKYSAHLDWHFRQNRREKDSARKAHSRMWYYDTSDWTQFETCEESDDRARSWFEMEKQNAETEGANAEDTLQETVLPSVPTGSDEDGQCQVCHDAFEQFYNEEKEEWHLRPAVIFEEKNYHPLCLEDHKRALEKSAMSVDEPTTDAEDDKKEEINESMDTSTDDAKDSELEPKEESIVEEPTEENVNPPEESVELTDEPKVESQEEISENVEEEVKPVDEENTESLEPPVETVDEVEVKIAEEIEEKVSENFDLVKIKEEPIDSMETEEQVFDFSNVHVKAEPEDPEPEPIVPETGAPVDTTLAAMTSSIDGNVELESTGSTIPAPQSKIKINITKTLITSNKEPEEPKEKPQSSDTPTEENPQLLVPASVKPSLQGRKLSVLPPVQKGHELSGLCSIM